MGTLPIEADMQRIVIIGAGAIGSALGGLLRRAGHDVLLVGRDAHVQAIQAAGLHVDGVLGSFDVKIDAAVAPDSRPDLAFLTVKSQDVMTTLQAHRHRLQGVPIVTFQNGVRSDDIAASVLPREQIISAVVNFHASFLQPGAVTINYAGPLVIGRPFGAHDALVDEIARILRSAFPTEVSGNIRGVHWLKLIVNLNNALPALTNLAMVDVYQDSTCVDCRSGPCAKGCWPHDGPASASSRCPTSRPGRRS
jgi:2-dehydropantoate 2-reductase